MKRKAIVFSLALVFLVITLFAVPVAEASGSNRASIIYSSQWLSLDIDRNYMLWACNDIYSLFLGEYTNAEYYYDHVENFHAQTTWTLMKSKITHCENYHTFATVLYIGHGGVVGGYYNIFEQAAHNDINNPPPSIWDCNIVQYTAGKHYFVFLWACYQGNEPGGGYPLRGMAYCWTRQSYLSEDGYNSPDSRPYGFIGFQNASPRLSEEIKKNTNNLYKHWLVFFYYHALNGYSVKSALDRASKNVGYEGGWLDANNSLRIGFETYWPFPPVGNYTGKMRIFGNGNIYLA